MSDPVKRMSAKEFRELGYLQEVNRQFLHPHGLALEVVIDDETGAVSFGGVWDYRDDPEGIIFGDKRDDQRANAERVRAERERHAQARYAMFHGDGVAELDEADDVEPLDWVLPDEDGEP